jgi:hypothetical protein
MGILRTTTDTAARTDAALAPIDADTAPPIVRAAVATRPTRPAVTPPPTRAARMDDADRYDAAYRRTRYRVHALDSPFELRVDTPCAPLAALMRRHGVATAAYLTACNPRSVLTPDSVNREANAALHAALLHADAFVFHGEAIDPTGAWPAEPSFLALGIALATARELGMRFRQNALLFADDDAVPRLIWLPRGV